jgi:NADPH-dependent 2,4-dienoyl-CoA reductase/sulfur reductase-like enzyme
MDRLIVIGGVAAGTTAAARSRRCCNDGKITLYEQEDYVSYAG